MQHCSRTLTRLAALGLWVYGLGCTAPPFQTIAELQRAYELPSLPRSIDYPEADAVVVLSTTETELYAHGDADELRTDQVIHRMIRVFRNIEEHSAIEFDLSPDERLVSIHARVIDPAGKPTILTRADIGVEQTTLKVSDPHEPDPIPKNTIRFRFPNASPGSTLEYRYRLRRDSPYIYDSWAVQEYVPVLYTHYRLTVPQHIYDGDGKEWGWRFRRYRCARIQNPRIYESTNLALGATTEYLWTHRDIRPFRVEPEMPPHQEYLSFVRFAHDHWRDWDAVTKWYSQTYLTNALLPTRKIENKARALTRGLGRDEERIEAVSRFVQNLPSVDLRFGEGSIAPARPEQTLSMGRGDSKDKAVLAVALLRSLEVEASLALVVTSDRGSLDRDFPNWNFNHMLIVIDASKKTPVWIDLTNSYHPIGDLPWRAEGVEAVVIEPDGTARVAETPVSLHTENRTVFDAQIEVRSDSIALVRAHLEFFGDPAAMTVEQINRTNVAEFALEIARSDFPDAQLSAAVTTTGTFESCAIEFEYTTSSFVETEDVFPHLRTSPFPFQSGLHGVGEDLRKYPIDAKFASTWIRTWTVNLEESPFRFAAMPSPIEVENRAFRYRSQFEQSLPHQLEAHQVLEVRTRRVLPLHFDEARLVAADLNEGGGKGVLLQVVR